MSNHGSPSFGAANRYKQVKSQFKRLQNRLSDFCKAFIATIRRQSIDYSCSLGDTSFAFPR